MKKFDRYPKAFKKTIRYIKQEASLQQLEDMEKLIRFFISERKKDLKEA